MNKKITQAIKNIREVLSKRFFQVAAALGILLLLLAIGLPAWQLFPEIRQEIAVPLHYNIHFGVDYFGEWWKIFSFPLAGLIIYILNFILVIAFWRRDKVLAYFFAAVADVCAFVILVAMVFVTLLNLSYA